MDKVVISTMGEIYRFRTVEQLLAEKYKELERQTIYFAHPEQLNDPMEGLRDIVWDGDEVVWTNLFKHYIYCLHSTWLAVQIAGDQFTVTSEEIPIFGRWDEHASPQLQAVFEKVWNRVFAGFGIGELARSLAEVDHGLRFNELLWHLNFMHSETLVVIKDVYVDHGYFPEAERTDSPSKLSAQWLIDSGFFNILPEFRKEESYNNLSSDRRQRFFETLFSIPTYITRDQLLARKYDRYRKVADTPIEKNRRMLVLDFPEVYLNCVERLLWPQWYTACFTRNYQNSSMWGNYANNHKGVCLGF